MEKIKKVFDLTDKKNLIKQSLEFIEEELKNTKRVSKYVRQSLLLSEELLVSMLDAAPDEGELRVSVRHDAWNCEIKMSAPGEEMKFDLSDEADTEAYIRNTLLDSYSDKLCIRSRKGFNSIRLSVGVKDQKFAFQCSVAILLGVGLFALCDAILPQGVVDVMCAEFFLRVADILLDMFRVILYPVIFLSIIAASAKIASSLGMDDNIGLKTLNLSFLSSIGATIVGLLSFSLFDNMIDDAAIITDNLADKVGGLDLFEILFSLVPKNFIAPFVEENVLQIVFMGVVFGVAINSVSEHTNAFIGTIDAVYEIIRKIVAAVGKFVPFGIFCSSFVVSNKYGSELLTYMIPIVACILFGQILMFGVYIFNIWSATRLNPFIFAKKILPHMKDLIRYGSGLDALPDTMRFCRTKLGVSREVCSITLPFGAQFNLDGTCIYMSIVGLALAKLCGITMYGNNILTMIFSIVVLSMGAPNLFGSNIICLITLLTSIGVSQELLLVIVCVDPLIALGIAVLNTVGDTVMSICIAHKTGLLNKDAYRRLK